MISNNQPHAYIDQGRKFYAFFLNFEQEREGKIFKGFHFFCFDQHGYCWFSACNTTRQFLNQIADGLFLERPAWQADTTHAFYTELERDNWMPDSPIDVSYALETVREATGLDLVLLYRGNPEAPHPIKEESD